MVDSVEHLDMIEAAAGSFVAPVRVAMDIDALLVAAARPAQDRAQALADPHRRAGRRRWRSEIERRERVKLVGLMAYEGQIAGVGDNVPGKSITNVGDPGHAVGLAKELARAPGRDRHRRRRGRPSSSS